MIIANYMELRIPETIKSQNWEKALAWLSSDSWKNITSATTEVDGDNVFVKKSSFKSKPARERQYEIHRLYADIQMPLKGTELHLFFPMGGLKNSVPYSEEKDIEFFEDKPGMVEHRIILSFPMVAVYFPWELHKTCVSIDGTPTENEKIIVKVRM